MVNLLSRVLPEPMKDSNNDSTILSAGFSKDNEIICKEEIGKLWASSANLDRVLFFGLNRALYGSGEPFHAYDEQIRGPPLPNFPRQEESICFPVVNQDLDRAGADTGHDELGKIMGEIKESLDIFYVGPFDSIKGLF